MNRVFLEDDATIHLDGESWRAAWKRLVGKEFDRADILSVEDHGHGEETLHMVQGFDIFRSYPGNNAIYKREGK